MVFCRTIYEVTDILDTLPRRTTPRSKPITPIVKERPHSSRSRDINNAGRHQTLSDAALESLERVLEQDLCGDAAHAAGYGAGPGGDLADAFPVAVASVLAAFDGDGGDIDDDRARLDELAGDHAGLGAHGGDQDVGLAADGGQVGRFAVADGDGAVLVEQQQRDRLA